MIDAQERNKQRKILTTITYNDLGIILDVKVEELDSSADLQPTCNQLATDCISRQEAIDVIRFECGEWTGLAKTIENKINELPSAQPEIEERMSETEQNVPNDDFISRKRAIDALMEDIKRIPTNAIRAKTVIEQLPPAQPEQRWITSGKPMNSGMYLVTLRQKFEGEEAYGVRIMRFINGNWMLPKHFPGWINEEIEQEVLAWRELPEPWKEGEADGQR